MHSTSPAMSEHLAYRLIQVDCVPSLAKLFYDHPPLLRMPVLNMNPGMCSFGLMRRLKSISLSSEDSANLDAFIVKAWSDQLLLV